MEALRVLTVEQSREASIFTAVLLLTEYSSGLSPHLLRTTQLGSHRNG